VVRGGPLPAHAGGGDRRLPGPGEPRPRAGSCPRHHRVPRRRQRGSDQRDRADHGPRRDRVRQPGRRGRGSGGPLPPPGPDQQRRGGHGARPPAQGRGGAAPGGRGPPVGRAHPPGADRGRHGDDGSHPLGPRGAHHVRAQVRGLGLRGRTRPRAARRRHGGDRHRQDQRPRGHLQPPRAGPRGGGARDPRPAGGPGEHADRPARPPCRLPRGHRHPGRHPGAPGDGGPEPPAHRDRRGHGALQARPEGQLGDAPQAQPHPVRAHRGPGAAAARLRPDGVREPAAVARARHQPQQCGTGDPAGRHHPARLHAVQDHGARRRARRPPGADA